MAAMNGDMTDSDAKARTVEATSNVATLQQFLAAHPDIKFVCYYVSDYSGILLFRCTTISRALQIAAESGSGIVTGSPVTSVSTQSGNILFELFSKGNDVWIPDWSSLREFTASKGTATLLCSVEEQGDADGDLVGMQARCPRRRLQNVLKDVKAKHGLEFLIGFEIEFCLVESPEATGPLAAPSGTMTSASLRAPEWKNVVEESVTLLEAAGISVWSFNQEAPGSKYEISLSPLRPLQAVDALYFAHETIKTVAKNAGVHATMHAKAFQDGPTAGKHFHISLSKPELGTPFLAGVLKHFRALCGLMLSNVDSYQRAGHFGSGAVCWGWQNKMTCIKRMQDAYFECRPPDSFANMYLVLAAFIGVGVKGIENGEQLNSKSVDELWLGPPSAEARKKFDITQDVPASLGESLEELKKDMAIKHILGNKCFERYLYNKQKDMEASMRMSYAERRKFLIVHF